MVYENKPNSSTKGRFKLEAKVVFLSVICLGHLFKGKHITNSSTCLLVDLWLTRERAFDASGVLRFGVQNLSFTLLAMDVCYLILKEILIMWFK